jgi:serine/threonine-protein kinase SRK2
MGWERRGGGGQLPLHLEDATPEFPARAISNCGEDTAALRPTPAHRAPGPGARACTGRGTSPRPARASPARWQRHHRSPAPPTTATTRWTGTRSTRRSATSTKASRRSPLPALCRRRRRASPSHPLQPTGAFGAVVHARDRATGEEVAVKLIPLGDRFHGKYVAREIANHRRLAHPHIVAFREAFLTEAHLCIAMEYVGGGNLQQWVEARGRLPEWQARCFFQQLALALRYAHASALVAHRDVKLGNVLLNDRYAVPILKLCDFGYSKATADASLPKTRVGTAAYISPEVARAAGVAAYDVERADVWSAGVTLYCMLGGQYPFVDADAQVSLARIQRLAQGDVEAALARLPPASPGCLALLRRVLAVDPARRARLEDLLVDEWFREHLPDMSGQAAPAPREPEPQEEAAIAAVLAEAERRSAARRAERAAAEAALDAEELADAALDELGGGGGGGGAWGANSAP